MITIQSAESALKNIYLDAVINDINTKTNPFLTMVQKNAKTVSGKEARALIRYGNRDSVVAGTEGGELPLNLHASAAEIATPLKNLYGTFHISDKAIRASQNNPGAFATLLSNEMQNLVGTAQRNLNTMVYGNGIKFLGHTVSVDVGLNDIFLPERFMQNFHIGQRVRLFTSNNIVMFTGTVKEFHGTNAIEFVEQMPSMPIDRYFVYSASEDDNGTEFSGIDTIFRHDTMYNIPVAERNREIAPLIVLDEHTIINQVLNEDQIVRFLSLYEDHCQSMPADILLTHPIARRALFEGFKHMRFNSEPAMLQGGFKGFTFNGLPVYCDTQCRGGVMYALNSDGWNMHQLCDWTWLSGEEGGVLRQMDGKAGYSATLVKYADLLCEKPFIQGKAANFSAVNFM